MTLHRSGVQGGLDRVQNRGSIYAKRDSVDCGAPALLSGHRPGSSVGFEGTSDEARSYRGGSADGLYEALLSYFQEVRWR
jgi:hypothetical protein